VVIGIGVNVARAPELPPAPRVPRPGSLADADAASPPRTPGRGCCRRCSREIERGRAQLVAGDGAALLAPTASGRRSSAAR
jgi:hypothetical protein